MTAHSTQHTAREIAMLFPQRLVAWCVAGLLVVASLLQAKGAIADYLRFDIRFPAAVTLAIVTVEVFVAALILGFPGHRSSWGIVAGLFLAFTSMATWRTLSGVRDCGCFGEVSVAPKITAVVDAVIFFAATVGIWSVGFLAHRERATFRQIMADSIRRSLIATCAGVALVFVCVHIKVGADNIGFGLSRPYTSLTGNVLDQKSGVFSTILPIHNSGFETVRIYGCESNCSTRCMAKLPLDVPKGTRCDLEVVSRFPASTSEGIVRLPMVIECQGSLRKVLVTASVQR